MAQNVVDETLVKQFNGELVSLYETKPPITKTKMVEITKAAMKAIKFYKHVVQSVEKFIMKCKPEYKLPGLYVIDSIVRQSRHQYGVDRDVFAPRFAKNMSATIEGTLKHCPEGDKVRIARVMHLWLKNVVFPEDCLKNCIEMAEGMGAHAGASSDEKSKPAPKPRKRSDDTNESKHAKQSRSRHEIQNDQPASPPAARPTPLSEQQTRAAAAPPPPPPPAEQHQKTDQLDPAFFEQIKTLTETIVEQQQKQKKGKTSSQFSRLLKSGFDYSDESGDDDDKDDEVNSSVNRTHDSSLSQQPPLPPPPPQQHTSHEDLLRKLQADAMGQPAAPPPSADNLNQMQSINSIPAPASTAASLLGPPPGNQPPPGFAPQNMPFDFSRPPPGFSAPPPGAAPSMPPSGAAPQQPQQQHMPSLLGAVAAAQPQAHFVAPPPSGGLGSPPSQAHLQPHPLQRDVCLRILPPRGPEPMPPGMGGAFGPAPVEQLEEQHGRKQHRRGQADENDAENHRSKRKRKHRSHSRSRSRSRRRGSRQPPVGDVQRDDSPEPIDAPPKRHRDKDRDRSDRDRDRGDKDRDHRRSHRADRDKDRSDRDGREQRSSRDRDRDRDRNRDKDRDKDRDTKERDRDHRTSRRSPERKSSSSRHHSRTADCSTTAEPSVPGMVPDSEPMPEPDKEKDIEKDRKKLGLPPVTVGITCLASRSLWLGRVPMTTSTEKLTEVFAEHIHGQVEHVDLLNAQGMAIVTLADRRDAVRVMERARTSLSVHGKALKVNWAMGKPIKDDPTLKEFWDAERGLSMIPWQRLPMDITPLCAAAHLDVSSMPPHLQELHTERGRKEPLASTSAGPTNQMQMPPMSMSGMPPAMMMGYGMPPPPFNIRPPGPAGFPFPPPMFGGPPGPRHGAIMHGGPGGDGGPPRTPVGAQHAGGEQASGASRPPWSAPPGAGGAPRGDRFGGPRFERGGGRGGAPFTPRGPSGGGFEGGRFGGGRGGPPERGRGGRFDGGRGSRFDGGRGGGFDGGRGGGRGFRGNTRDRQPYPDRRPERNFGGETEERRRPSRWMAEDAEPDRNGKGDAGEMKPDAVEKPAKSSGAVEPSSAVTAPEPELDENQKMMALMGLPVGFGVDKPEKEFE